MTTTTMRRRDFMATMSRLGLATAAYGGLSASRLTIALSAQETRGAIAETTAGRVRGSIRDGVHIFRGVPYGATTGGVNRFMTPKPPEPWADTHDALAYGPSVPQPHPQPVVSEDALRLNVWTGGLADGGRRPVMVWLHGGGFSSGSGSSKTYDGVNLCHRGDVVVVTINHRLNVFGSLYLAELGGPQFAHSGCAGMLDIVAALEWVRDNIAAFGGEPGRVMIFGESGGGRKVSTLLAMPAAKGLFHRAIIESGAILRLRTPRDATREAELVLAELGIARSEVERLQQVPDERLLEAHLAALRTHTPEEPVVGMTTSTPVLDGDNLPVHPYDPTATTISADVPVVVGYNRTEETLFANRGPNAEFDMTDGRLRERISERLGSTGSADEVVDVYRTAHSDATPWDLYILISTDHPRGMYARELAERKSSLGGAPAFLYRFDWEMDERMKTPHALEIRFVFDNVDHFDTRLFDVPATPASRALAAKMSAAWIAFAGSGDPNTSDLPTWPAYSATTRDTMLFNESCRVVRDPGRGPRRVMEGVLGLT